jgi:probable H4MPT-linked C1 transfer pathway protein
LILGWDIGGVNTKVARLDDDGTLSVRSRPFELQRDPDALVRVLRELADVVPGFSRAKAACAVTLTAELSQMFRTKREGVSFVLDAVSAAFPDTSVSVFTTDGRFLSPDNARNDPLAVAAANWAATAHLVAARYRTALLVDIGTTTTDIIPIVGGEVVATGTTDPERLASGELVYSGALRTPVEAVVRAVPYRGGQARVSAEAFALVGDVHVWRGQLAVEDYTVPTPDGRPATREFAAERIARVICADRDLLDEAGIARIADAVAAEQVATIAAAIRSVRSRHPAIQTAVVTGLGEFIAIDAARAAGLEVVSLAGELGSDAARYAPAAAVALLLASDRGAGKTWRGPCQVRVGEPDKARPTIDKQVDLVIKVGGGLLAHIDHLDRVLAAIAELARDRNVLIVPGGGPFADAVRAVDVRVGLGDEQAHWMAILAMDQYAHLLAARIPRGTVVQTRSAISDAHARGQVPVVAPSTWLSAADPLPHTWDVTSDSIAAWIAGEVRAPRLVLVKPPGAQGQDLVDGYFSTALPADVSYQCVEADQAIEGLMPDQDGCAAGERDRTR